MDAVPAPGEVVGRFTARVALLELVAARAEPLAVEPDPTGRTVLDGIRAELAAAGMPDLPVTGSMEKNMPTVMTAVTVTAVGLARPGTAKAGRAGDRLVVIGAPKVGREVRLDDPALADVPAARALLGHSGVHALIPAGSGGVRPECEVLAAEAGCDLLLDEPDAPLLRKPAGPATCLVAAVDPARSGRSRTVVVASNTSWSTVCSPPRSPRSPPTHRILPSLPAPVQPPAAPPPPIIGRERELAGAEASLAHAWSGNGRVVLVSGDAGIGKSRLVTELLVRLRARPESARGTC